MAPNNGNQPFALEDPDGVPRARTGLPVVVIGTGPVGLAAAAHLLERGLEPLVLEAGPQVGANIAQWRHVRLFSPWRLALDPVSVRLLDQAGWTGPDPDTLPTGADLLDRYLEPLAALPALASRIRLHTTVVAVARHDLDKVRSPGRDQLPFQVRIRDDHDQLHDLLAGAVIDASGTWTQPNPLGPRGYPPSARPTPTRRSPTGPLTSWAATAAATPAGGRWWPGPGIRPRPAWSSSSWRPACSRSAVVRWARSRQSGASPDRW
jgi:glycine/D-amino acid oxidase-like deaminating enzyme